MSDRRNTKRKSIICFIAAVKSMEIFNRSRSFKDFLEEVNQVKYEATKRKKRVLKNYRKMYHVIYQEIVTVMNDYESFSMASEYVR